MTGCLLSGAETKIIESALLRLAKEPTFLRWAQVGQAADSMGLAARRRQCGVGGAASTGQGAKMGDRGLSLLSWLLRGHIAGARGNGGQRKSAGMLRGKDKGKALFPVSGMNPSQKVGVRGLFPGFRINRRESPFRKRLELPVS